jgi:hypothetical protein
MKTKALRWGLLGIALAALPVQWAFAQQGQPYERFAREGYRIGKAEAEKLEAALAGNPDDLDTRTRLLGFWAPRIIPLVRPLRI